MSRRFDRSSSSSSSSSQSVKFSSRCFLFVPLASLTLLSDFTILVLHFKVFVASRQRP